MGAHAPTLPVMGLLCTRLYGAEHRVVAAGAIDEAACARLAFVGGNFGGTGWLAGYAWVAPQAQMRMPWASGICHDGWAPFMRGRAAVLRTARHSGGHETTLWFGVADLALRPVHAASHRSDGSAAVAGATRARTSASTHEGRCRVPGPGWFTVARNGRRRLNARDGAAPRAPCAGEGSRPRSVRPAGPPARRPGGRGW